MTSTVHRSLGWTYSIIAAFVVGWAIPLTAKGSEPSLPEPGLSSNLFSGPLRRFEIYLAPDAMVRLRRQPNIDVEARLQVGGEQFEKIGVHLKGQGSFRPVDTRPSLTIHFGKFEKGGRFCGMEKVHLNDSIQDETFLTEVLAAELYLRAGVPTGRATPCLVSLNGRDLGPYVLKEGLDRHFLRRSFSGGAGNLYENCWGCDLDREMFRISGSGPDDQIRREQLVALLKVPMSASQLEELGKLLDLDGFISFSALQCLTDDWDGYLQRANNYRLYENVSDGRFVMLPYGMDMVLQRPESVVVPRMRGLIARSVFSSLEMRQKLEARISALTNSVFAAAVITNTLGAAEKRLIEALGDAPTNAVTSLRRNIDALRRRALDRLDRVCTDRVVPIEFNARREYPLTNWEPRLGNFITPEQHSRRQLPNGREVLVLRVDQPATLVQWRTRAVLSPGEYRFEGRARCRGVVPYSGPRSRGAGIRTMLGSVENQIDGNADWTFLSHSFRMTELSEVDLSVELRAHAGEAEFDLGSLKLVRER